MLPVFVIGLLAVVARVQGNRGNCKSLKREFPDLKITRKPLSEPQGTCGLSRTCCTADVEEAIKQETLSDLRQVVKAEVASVRASLTTIKDMTAVQMRTMIDDLVPPEAKDLIDFSAIGDLIWEYTIGNITAYDLTVEVAVIGSRMLFKEEAAQELLDMTECIVRELGEHATDAFTQITAIVQNFLEAPRAYGIGFDVVETLLRAMEEYEEPSSCKFGNVVGCPRCSVNGPGPCRSLCILQATECTRQVWELEPLWKLWIDSITSLVDAMVLMKDIQVNPNDIVTPDLVQQLTNDILGSMGNVNFEKCRSPRKRRSIDQSDLVKRLPTKRDYSEGELMKSILINYFGPNLMNKACKDTSSNTNCWLGNEIGDYTLDLVPQSDRATKSYVQDTSVAAAAINSYRNLVSGIISDIHAKVREQRDQPPVPEGYTMFSSAFTYSYCNLLILCSLLVTILLRNTVHH